MKLSEILEGDIIQFPTPRSTSQSFVGRDILKQIRKAVGPGYTSSGRMGKWIHFGEQSRAVSVNRIAFDSAVKQLTAVFGQPQIKREHKSDTQLRALLMKNQSPNVEPLIQQDNQEYAWEIGDYVFLLGPFVPGGMGVTGQFMKFK